MRAAGWGCDELLLLAGRRVRPRAAHRQPGGGGARRDRPRRRPDGSVRPLDQPLRDDVPAAAHGPGGGLPLRIFTPADELPFAGSPHPRERPRLARGRRCAGARKGASSRSVASAWSSSGATARTWRSVPLTSCVPGMSTSRRWRRRSLPWGSIASGCCAPTGSTTGRAGSGCSWPVPTTCSACGPTSQL